MEEFTHCIFKSSSELYVASSGSFAILKVSATDGSIKEFYKVTDGSTDLDGLRATGSMLKKGGNDLYLGLRHIDGSFGLTKFKLGHLEVDYFLKGSREGSSIYFTEDKGKLYGVGYQHDATNFYIFGFKSKGGSSAEIEREFLSDPMSASDYYLPMQAIDKTETTLFICAEHTGKDKLGYMMIDEYDKDDNVWNFWIDSSETSGDI